jgi:hypothetical protein
MKIQGTLPPWLRGTLYRTVPATFESSYSVAINDDEKETHWIHFEHLFDCLPALVSFRITSDGKELDFNACMVARGLDQKICLTHGLPRYFQTWLTPAHQSSIKIMTYALDKPIAEKTFKAPDKVHCGGNVLSMFPAPMDLRSPSLCLVPSLTPPVLQFVDPQSLRPLQITSMLQIKKDCRGCYMTPQWQYDRLTRTWFGCLMDYGMGYLGRYTQLQVMTMSENGSLENMSVLVTVTLPEPAIIHSFAVTQHFVIIVCFLCIDI